MVSKYTCPRCGYSTNKLSSYKDHLEKKKLCEGEASLLDEYIKYDIDLEDRLRALFAYTNKLI